MKTPQEYYLSVIGRAIDVDGSFGAQCVDGFNHFCRNVVGYTIQGALCDGGTKDTGKGYACRIWDNYEILGLDKYFDKVPVNQMVDGDWAIWSFKSVPCPYSHIAMFRKDNGDGTGVFLGQNQGGISNYSQVNISYSGIRGALRPKCYHTDSSNEKVDQILHIGSKVKFNGIFEVDVLKFPYSSNLFGNTQLTGISSMDYLNGNAKDYHWIPLDDFTEVDQNGNRENQDQIVTVGNHVINDNTYIVKGIDIKTDSAKLELNGHIIWVYCACLVEV